MWQDKAILFCNAMFIISVAYQVYTNFMSKKCGVSIYTSLSTSIVLIFMTYTLYSLNLILSSLSSFISSILWLVIFFQKISFKEKKIIY